MSNASPTGVLGDHGDDLRRVLGFSIAGGLWARMATHVVLTALLIDGDLSDHVTSDDVTYGPTSGLAVEAGLGPVDRMIVRCGTAALWAALCGHWLAASIVVEPRGVPYLAANAAVPIVDPILELTRYL